MTNTKHRRTTSPVVDGFALNGTGLALLALTAVTAIGSTAVGAIVDTSRGFVLRSGGSIALEGNVYASSAIGALGNVTVGWGSTVNGPIEIGAARTWTNPITSWTTPQGSNIDLAWSQTRSLTAGGYGAFTSNSSTTLNLGSGTYTFSSFQLGWNGKVVANTSAGDVYLYVNGALASADATRFEKTGAGNLFLVTGGTMAFGYQANVQAALYSGGTLTFGGDSRLTGLAYAANNINAGYGSAFTFTDVPAPGTLALMGLAGCCSRRRRV